jgi:hypothetical protein
MATKTSPKHYFLYLTERAIEDLTVEYSDLLPNQKSAETDATDSLENDGDESSIIVFELVPRVKLTTSSDVIRTVLTTK